MEQKIDLSTWSQPYFSWDVYFSHGVALTSDNKYAFVTMTASSLKVPRVRTAGATQKPP